MGIGMGSNREFVGRTADRSRENRALCFRAHELMEANANTGKLILQVDPTLQ
jgi:hypothetical protein